MKAKFIINPSSGKQLLQKKLDRIIGNLILEGTLNHIDVLILKKKGDAYESVKALKKDEYDYVVAVGGDGTVNEVINGIMIGKNKIPLAILPAGTVNDFANYLQIPTDVWGFCNMLKKNQKKKVDVGKIGDRYFINVLAGGILTDVGYKVSSNVKTWLGKYAYYVEGMKEIPKQMFKSIKLSMETEECLGEEDTFMFIISNTPMVGGFKRLAPKAKIDDGMLDICIIKKSDIPEFIGLFFQAMKGEHIYHPKVVYLQSSKIRLECKDYTKVNLDIDGEEGGALPATIEVIPKVLEVFTP
ncbi:diacylglycerol/lipid kinase family protein [Anaerophilus nitritogenes]|uniref:diacylglycerol/lipid kinase family protein n=1 Tax=Anaerophilus nitritogenes TaxID=2498136 RepID=UPI00101B93FE|nr:YegS/Rv2252/BmrU family lipid kinase [Anaerophilus nitritogenes]